MCTIIFVWYIKKLKSVVTHKEKINWSKIICSFPIVKFPIILLEHHFFFNQS